ncbi:hypothetical protein I8748_23400 [Nostoc sp. CENA67]|uniref:Uncharacterized protein n=1 Tax=Amazonocrinis nigriterrae CENA67 TaxID=2794033 RepID=A0A8J7HS34_9NOST|nr:hypothetical protein [Amazonocrinis nigriterrae]MBH8565093.1 hypothetical protein [Amazonocrinis nigriterrae CENA67]
MSTNRTTVALSPEHKKALEAIAQDLLGSPNVSLLMRNIAEGRLTVTGQMNPVVVLRHDLPELKVKLEEVINTINEVLGV